MSEKKFTVLIADDDPEQLTLLASLLASLRPEWEIVARISDAAGLSDAIYEQSPSLCILDVELGQATGIEIVQGIQGGIPVIFVTGHTAYAVDAFDCSALDFVVKPVRAERLEQALRKAEGIVGLGSTASRQATGEAAPTLVRFSRGRDMVMAPLEEVVYFQAQHKYTRVALRTQEGLLRMNLSAVAQHMDASRFWRVHRSYIVNIAHVASSNRDDMGRIVLRFADRSERLIVSKPYEHLFARDGFA